MNASDETFRSYLPPWPLPRAVEGKVYFETTQRICEPEETWNRFHHFRERAGITRLSDITYLDCIGIPTYQAVRPIVPHYQENISVYNGKGITKLQAKVSAMMEAYERFAGEVNDRKMRLGSLEEIRAEADVISPLDLTLPQGESYTPEQVLEWVPGLDLFTGKTTWLPAAQAFCPYHPSAGGRFFPNFSNTNGLASGNSLGEALAHALFELIERDSEAMGWASRKAETIDLGSIAHPLIRELISHFDLAGVHLTLKQFPSVSNIPVFSAAADEPNTEDPALICYGMGCHLNPEIAVMRAITEVAQSRCGMISGLRGDLSRYEEKRSLEYRDLVNHLKFWLDPGPLLKNFAEIPNISHDNFVDDVEDALGRLLGAGFNRVVAVNLTHPDIPVPVVRVVVPGLEQSLESHRRGARFKSLLG